METAIEAIQAGAWDYLSKPLRVEEIEVTVRRALEVQRLVRENRQYREELRERYRVENFVGQAPEMLAIYKTVARVAGLDTTVLDPGRDGDGQGAGRPGDPLRGPARRRPVRRRRLHGAPRGALRERAVRARARGVHRRRAHAARAARDGERRHAASSTRSASCRPRCRPSSCACSRSAAFERVGGNDDIAVDVRVVAATNRDLKKRVEDGRVPGGSVLPAQRRDHPPAARCASAARTSRCSPSTSSRSTGRPTGGRGAASRARRSRCWPPTTGRGTSASSSTSSSGPWRSRRRS